MDLKPQIPSLRGTGEDYIADVSSTMALTRRGQARCGLRAHASEEHWQER